MNENHDDEDVGKELRKSRFQYALSTEDVRRVLDEHLFKGEKPIVVALDGSWGEGKTYFWKHTILPDYNSVNAIYVSVFGVATIQAIRERVVFEVLRNAEWFNKGIVKKSTAFEQ